MPLDTPAWRSAAVSELDADESLLLIAVARTQPGDAGHGLTLMPIGTLFRWGAVFINVWLRGRQPRHMVSRCDGA